MTAPIVTHDEDRIPWGSYLDWGTWEWNGDREALHGFAGTVPGQLWDRISGVTS